MYIKSETWGFIMSKVYDLIILGAGPAGLSAGIYAGRSRLDTLIIEKAQDGGQIAITDDIENYPGVVDGDTGPSLIARMSDQVEKFGAERLHATIKEVDFSEKIKKVITTKGEFLAKSVLVATGANPRPLGVPGEKEFTGKGISYCATCDGAFFEDFQIYVVGGGDSAVEEAIYLTRFGRKVTIIHRRDELRAAKSIQEKAFANDKIDFMWDSIVTEFKGEEGGLLTSMMVENVKTGEVTEVVADEEDGIYGVFVFCGFLPTTELFEGKLDMEWGYILSGVDMTTSVDGVFVAGDCRNTPLRQVVTAAADGAVAVGSIESYLADWED